MAGYTPTAPILIEFNLGGSREMKAALAALDGEIRQRAAAALRLEADQIIRNAKDKYVPVDLGNLKNSGRVEAPASKGKEISVAMHFGLGIPRPYAEAIHEYPTAHQPPSWVGKDVHFKPAGTGAKYLERPMKEQFKGMSIRLKKAIFSTVRLPGVHLRHSGGGAIGQAPPQPGGAAGEGSMP
jgi:hypothetical protein